LHPVAGFVFEDQELLCFNRENVHFVAKYL
jgi:hypothetical protein